jgi:hypothetical protein
MMLAIPPCQSRQRGKAPRRLSSLLFGVASSFIILSSSIGVGAKNGSLKSDVGGGYSFVGINCKGWLASPINIFFPLKIKNVIGLMCRAIGGEPIIYTYKDHHNWQWEACCLLSQINICPFEINSCGIDKSVTREYRIAKVMFSRLGAKIFLSGLRVRLRSEHHKPSCFSHGTNGGGIAGILKDKIDCQIGAVTFPSQITGDIHTFQGNPRSLGGSQGLVSFFESNPLQPRYDGENSRKESDIGQPSEWRKNIIEAIFRVFPSAAQTKFAFGFMIGGLSFANAFSSLKQGWFFRCAVGLLITGLTIKYPLT